MATRGKNKGPKPMSPTAGLKMSSRKGRKYGCGGEIKKKSK